ncbi:FAD-dependent monooxygenase [Streptomyces sp. BPSDS2]|uniref:FAD-dependent monooxygenase n=1 Tax=Streptomyces sp. BPSDS2 TaxID=2571021 RepID=UPI003211D137
MTHRNVLIAGAGIAGPALAHWLDRHGMRATLVERASALREGGQAVDLRGAGRDVAREMGLPFGVPRIASPRTRAGHGGPEPPPPIDPDLPGADIRIGYARCSTLGKELDSQLDAFAGHGIPRDKIFSEKVSTRVRVRPRFERRRAGAESVEQIQPNLFSPAGKRRGYDPSVAGVYRALTEHAEREAPLKARGRVR